MLFLVFSLVLFFTNFTSSLRGNSNPSSNTFSNNTIASSCIGDPDELRALLALASEGETVTICSCQNLSSKITKNTETAMLSR